MLKALKGPYLHWKFGRRVFVCLSKKQLGGKLLNRIHPIIVGPVACWTDKS